MKHTPSLGDPAELAALYAAGSLTHEDRIAFEAHLDAGCEACRAEVERLLHVVTALAAVVPPVAPDPRTRERLLARIAAGSMSSGEPSPLRPQLRRGPGTSGPEPALVLQRAGEGVWEDTDVPGVRVRVLYVDSDNNRFTALVRMAPGATYPRHTHGGPEECFVLEGDLSVGDDVMRTGDYQYAPAQSRHGVQRTDQGCLLLITSSLTDVFD